MKRLLKVENASRRRFLEGNKTVYNDSNKQVINQLNQSTVIVNCYL